MCRRIGATTLPECREPPSDLGCPWGARGWVPTHSEEVSNEHPTTRSRVADAAATLAVLVVGASLLAMTAPLVSAFAVVLTAVLYVPMRVRAVSSGTPAG